MKKIFLSLGVVSSYLFPQKIYSLFTKVNSQIHIGFIKKRFNYFGDNIHIDRTVIFKGEKYINLGFNVRLGKYGTLTAWDKYLDKIYRPQIIIKNNVSIGNSFHITAINSILIEENVLMGQKVTISDNSYGKSDFESLKIPPTKRDLYIKGSLKISKNVWIGDKAPILGNISIGEGSIVASNSVVTKNVPSYSIVAGVPAKIIKTLK